jgi:hypothetical protein
MFYCGRCSSPGTPWRNELSPCRKGRRDHRHRLAAVAGNCLIMRAGEATRPAPALTVTPTAPDPPPRREGWRRVTDGRVIDMLGGRVWQRIRVRFAVGPLAVVQTAWIGTVGGRTVVAVLSSGDDHAAAHLVTAAAAVASISAPR